MECLPADKPSWCDVADTSELWRGAAGLCACVRAYAGTAGCLHTCLHTYMHPCSIYISIPSIYTSCTSPSSLSSGPPEFPEMMPHRLI